MATQQQLQTRSPLEPFLRVTYDYGNWPDQHKASGLLRMMHGLLIGSLLSLILLLTSGNWLDTPEMSISLAGVSINRGYIAIALALIVSFVLFLEISRTLNNGQLERASRLYTFGLLLIATLIYVLHQPTSAIALGLSGPLVAGGLLLSRRDLLLVGTACASVVVSVVMAHELGIITEANSVSNITTLVFGLIVILVNGVMLQVFSRGQLVLLEERVRLLDEVQTLNQSLEQRVTARTRDLQLAADISIEISTQLDPEQLLAKITTSTAQAFDLYHVSIYLYDTEGETLKLAQGAGEAGELVSRLDRRVKLDAAGLVPRAARTQQVALSNHVLDDAHYLPSPLLPETRSEIAIPMVYLGRLIGVLDLQSNLVERFSDDDVRIMRTLADQVAVAVRNSELFKETQAAKEIAEQANATKSAFLAAMSHELRTPLNAIINFTKFVAKGAMGPVNDEQKETLEEVIDSGKHLLNLINDVLDMSKIGSGSLKLFVESDVDLRPVLQSVIAAGKTLIHEKPVSIEAVIADELPCIVGDRQRITQVLLNIMSNACKFTEQGQITLRAYSEDGHVFLSIADTGPGIAPEDQALVFEPFQQTETGLRQGGGTGLGMPISKSLVDAHGGRLWLDSQPGQGTTFYVALPVQSDKLEPLRIA
jgi:signal transduction histidine kinase